MTAAESLYRRYGALELPLAESQDDQAIVALDPARDILLDLFTAALNSELEPIWEPAVRFTALTDTTPVQQKLPAMPDAEKLAQLKTGWPMLCVSRAPTPAIFADYTIEQRSLTQRWDVDYILAPLSIGNLLRIQDVLQMVGKTIDLVVKERGHRAYRTTSNGNAIFAADVIGSGENCCGFQALRVVDMALGPAAFSAGGPKYHACGLTLESVELTGYLGDGDDDGEAVPLEGATGTFGITESGDPTVIVRA